MSKEINARMCQNKVAYLVARSTSGFGIVIKAIGLIVGALFVVGGLFSANEGKGADVFGIAAIGVGVLFYLGILVSAQGPIRRTKTMKNSLYNQLSSESELPIGVYVEEGFIAVHGWFPGKCGVAPHEALPISLNDWVRRADGFGTPVNVGNLSWQPALYKDIEIYRAGLLTQRAENGITTSIVAKIPRCDSMPAYPSEPDPSAAIKFVRETRVLPDDLDDSLVPTPKLIWFDPSVMHGEEGVMQLAWQFSFTGNRPVDVIVSVDGTTTLGTIAIEPENLLTYVTTPQYLLDSITGVPRFVSFVPPLLLPDAATRNSIAVAESFFQRFPKMFGTFDPSQQLRFKQLEPDLNNGQHVVFEQIYAGLLVWGCELRVHLNDALAITSISGRYYRDPDIDLTPNVCEEEAFSLASRHANRDVSPFEMFEGDKQGIEKRGLVVFPWRLAKPSEGNSLAWWFRFPDADRFVSAHTGLLIVAIPRRHSARLIYDFNGGWPWERSDFQLEDGVVRTTNPLDPEALTADNAMAATEGFWRVFGRNSWDNRGAHTIANLDVNYDNLSTPGIIERNAFWDGSRTSYSRDLAQPDIIGHEFTHAVTQQTAGLIYLLESGALNESFSDVFGKLIFPTPQPWIIGNRSLQNPAATPPPNGPCVDNYANYQFRAEDDDKGGVHFNSGIGNRAAFLVAEGDGTVAHAGLGPGKLARIWWDTLTTRLSPWSNYIDLVANAWHVTREFASGGRLGVQLPGTATQPAAFVQTDPGEVLWAFQQVGLELRLLTGWFQVPGNRTTEFVFYEGQETAVDEEVSDVIVRLRQQRDSGVTRFLMALQVSTGVTSGSKSSGGNITAEITQHGVGSRSMEVRVSVTALNGADVDVSAQIVTRRTASTPPPPPPTLPYPTPPIRNWTWGVGKRYDDILYEGIDLPQDCVVSNVVLELLDSNGGVVASAAFPQGAQQIGNGNRGASISARTVGGRSLQVRVASWHNVGSDVIYRLVYWITAVNCSLPDLTVRPARSNE